MSDDELDGFWSESSGNEETVPEPKKISAHLRKLQQDLGLHNLKNKEVKRPPPKTVTTIASRKLNRPPPELVVYEDPSHKKKSHKRNAPRTEPDKEDDPVDPKKIKFEVYQFGVSGFHKMKKEEEKIRHAVRLGAKPPKKEFQNYKELKVKRKREEQRQKLRNSLEHGLRPKKAKSRSKKKDKNKADVSGQVGKFQKGVLFVPKNLVGRKA